jgi:hypothetical protein
MSTLSKPMRAGVAILALIVAGSFALALKGRFDWNRYMREHHCQPAGHIHTRHGTQTVYRCDGNEIVVRH